MKDYIDQCWLKYDNDCQMRGNIYKHVDAGAMIIFSKTGGICKYTQQINTCTKPTK